MSRDKQIEEMAKDLCHTDTCEIKKIDIPCNHRCKAHIYATRAIEKGYRKASEVAREIFEETEAIIRKYDERPKYQLMLDLAELKKKYTESEDTE